jgi:hypothetical protein
MVNTIAWDRAPVVKLLGLDGETKFGVNTNGWPPPVNSKIEIIEDTMAPLSTTLAAAISTTSALTIQLTNPTYVHAGHMVLVDSELMLVDSANANGTVVLRKRGAGGTTAATHANAAAVTIEGISARPGSTPSIGYTTTTTQPYNWQQIMEEAVEAQDEAVGRNDYGVGNDPLDYNLAKLIGGSTQKGKKGPAGQMMILLGKMAYQSYIAQPSESEPYGIAGGLPNFITTHTTGTTSTELIRPTIHTQIRDIYDDGGMVDTMLTSTWGAEKVLQMYEGKVYTEISEERGGSIITWIRTPVCERLNIEVDWQCPATKSYLLDSSKVGYITIEPFHTTEFAKVDYNEKVGVKGIYSFMVANENSHAIITHSATL